MVGLAGPGGAGKSTVASMVVAREDVRASFHKGVLWLSVGQGAKDRLAELMHRLAGMVYETVMQKTCRPFRKQGIDNDPEDGVAYIREVVDESSRRFLVVADDVWEVEVLQELKRAGLWVIYTTRDGDLLPEAPAIRLDQILKEEAEMVLRRAADLADDADLPDAAYDLMELCEYGVMHLAFVGRWVHGRNDRQVWQVVLDRIRNVQEGGDDGQHVPWRAAVLRAGLEELAYGNIQNKELYISLAVIPKGLAFPSEVAAVLLYGVECSAEDRKAVAEVVATLERFSILTLEGGGEYRVHDDHVDFIQGRFATSQDARDRVLPRWRQYMSSAHALLQFSSSWLVKTWEVLARVGDEGIASRPYDATLEAMDPSSTYRPIALEAAADFLWQREDWSETFTKLSELLVLQETMGENKLDEVYTLNWLGATADRLERREESETFHRRALAIQEEKLGADGPEVADTLHSIGTCASKAGKEEEAEKLFRRALNIWEKEGVDHPDVAWTLYWLGLSAYRAGRTEEAEKFHRRALTIREEKLGADHPDVAWTLTELGVCAREAGRTEEAEKFHRRALNIWEKLGVDDPDLAITRWELARLSTPPYYTVASLIWASNVLVIGMLLCAVFVRQWLL